MRRPRKAATFSKSTVLRNSSDSAESIWNNPGHRFQKKLTERWVFAGLILLILSFSATLRMIPFKTALDQPERFFHGDKPLIRTYDGYYYMRYARDLIEGTYKPFDELRFAPQGSRRPYPPPLLSSLTAVVAEISGGSIEWVAMFLPAFIGILIFFPLYYIGLLTGGAGFGLLSAVAGLVAPYYVLRTNVGWYDTDCGNVVFILTLTALAIAVSTYRGRKRLIALGAYLVVFLSLFLWWDTAQDVVIAIGTVQMILAFVLMEGRRKNSLVLVGFFVAAAFALISLVKGFLFWQDLARSISSKILYIFKSQRGPFPNIGISISEQRRFPVWIIMRQASGTVPAFFVSVAGLFYLFFERPRKTLHLLVPAGLGALAFTALRFTIFLGPVLAIGLTSMFFSLHNRIRRLSHALSCQALLWACSFVFLPSPWSRMFITPIVPPNTLT